MIGDSYNLTHATELKSALHDLRGYWKIWSACLLQSLSLPTLRGVVVTRFNESVGCDLDSFLKEIGATSALIRHDRRNEVPPYPRGGFVIPNARLRETIQSFLCDDRIVAVYEPMNRLRNGYNLNLLFESTDEVLVEIVGPGFDASNLQRGDITPHEVLKVQITQGGIPKRIMVLHRTTDEEYRRSITDRMQKLHEFPPSFERQSVRSDLFPPPAYRPIPRGFVEQTLVAVTDSEFIPEFRKLTQAHLPINISSSYVDDGRRQIFWDATAPSLKYEGLISKSKLAR